MCLLSLWGWYCVIVFTVPTGWYVVFTVPDWSICRVYRPCGDDLLCLPSLRGWCIVFTVPAGLMYCFYRPCGTGVVVYCVYRPCGADMLCLPFLHGWYVCRVYRPCRGDVLWLPSLWGWCIFLCLPFSFRLVKGQIRVNVFILVPGGPMICCVYRPWGARGWCVVVMSTIPVVWSMCSIYLPYGTIRVCSHYHHLPEGLMMGCVVLLPSLRGWYSNLCSVYRPSSLRDRCVFPNIFQN